MKRERDQEAEAPREVLVVRRRQEACSRVGSTVRALLRVQWLCAAHAQRRVCYECGVRRRVRKMRAQGRAQGAGQWAGSECAGRVQGRGRGGGRGGGGGTLEDEDHRQVGDATAQVAPASGGGVGQADDFLGELLRAPHLHAGVRPLKLLAWGQGAGVCTARLERGAAGCHVVAGGWWVVAGGWRLARNERSEAATDKEAAGDEAGGVGDEHDAQNEGACQEEAEGQALARTHHIANGAHHEAREDGAGDRGDVAQVKIVLGELKVALDEFCLRRGGAGRGDERCRGYLGRTTQWECRRPPRLTN